MKSPSRWKRRILFVLFIGAVFGVIFSGLHYSTQHVPDFYREALNDTNVTVKSAQEFQERTTQLLERIEETPDWTESFTEQQINSWLAYDFPELEQDLVPLEVSKPRVRFQEGYILTACRYEGEDFSGILSLKIRPRVTENHELVLELSSVKAGLLPIPLERILQEAIQQGDLQGWSLNLVEIGDEEVLVVSHESSEQSVPKLASIQVDEQLITIIGESRHEDHTRLSRSLDHSGSATKLPN